MARLNLITAALLLMLFAIPVTVAATLGVQSAPSAEACIDSESGAGVEGLAEPCAAESVAAASDNASVAIEWPGGVIVAAYEAIRFVWAVIVEFAGAANATLTI